ncbi:hypothetical protein OHA70_10320 [Kribbella sp. NBC_00382]|uniref:hypothetical protein n=1 Tax=Kribbella sp. NBC_00382 TaxID=2975967 RepID=UPI002E1FCA4A
MLTRATVIGVAVAVLATGGLATAAVAHSHSSSDGAWSGVGGASAVKKSAATHQKPVDKVPALKAAQVRYQHQSWGDSTVEAYIGIWAPTGWKKVKLSPLEAKFTSPNGLWNLRVDATEKDQLLKATADNRYAVIKASVADFHLISRVTGSTRATNANYQGMVFHHQTLTYTYTDPTRGPRLVIDRFVSLDTNPHPLFETTTGGRPQDAAALSAVTTKATEDFIRLP